MNESTTFRIILSAIVPLKKSVLFLLSSLSLVLTSCEMKDDGSVSLTGFGWVVIIVFILIFVLAAVSGTNKQKKSCALLKEKGLAFSDFKSLGSYVGGHPELNETVPQCYFLQEKENICLYQIQTYSMSLPLSLDAQIPISEIMNISIEDATSIEKKITVGRIFLVGIFALGWRKKKKNELAFLVIEWKRGKFEHLTTFSFEGKDAFQNANIARNELIHICE